MPKRGIHLVSKQAEKGAALLRPDRPVLQDGVYRVIHEDGSRSQEVTLLAGETFPRCQQCGTEIEFEFLRGVAPTDENFRIRLYTIPHPREDEEEKRKAAIS